MDKITHINLVLKDYFDLNKSVVSVAAKDMMPYFVLAGVFDKYQKNGLPIIYILKKLTNENRVHLIPFAFADKKNVYTKWFFVNGSCSRTKIVEIQNTIQKAKLKKTKLKTKLKKIKDN